MYNIGMRKRKVIQRSIYVLVVDNFYFLSLQFDPLAYIVFPHTNYYSSPRAVTQR